MTRIESRSPSPSRLPSPSVADPGAPDRPVRLDTDPGPAPRRSGSPGVGESSRAPRVQLPLPTAAPAAARAAGGAAADNMPLPQFLAELQQWVDDPARAPQENRQAAAERIRSLAGTTERPGAGADYQQLDLRSLGLTGDPNDMLMEWLGRRGPAIHFDMAAAHSWPDMEARPLGDAVRGWHPEGGAGTSSAPPPGDWAVFADEPYAADFSLLLDRLRETADWKNARTRPLLERRVRKLLARLEQDPSLRRLCFAMAEDAMGRCGDRVALGLDRIEQAVENHRAERGEFDEGTLLRLGRRRFRLAQLDRMAAGRMRSLRFIDEVEVQLAYRTRLAKPLDLGRGLQDMLYFDVSGVRDIDLRWAEVMVELRERGPALAGFLAGQAAWQQHLERSRPHEYAGLRREIAELRAPLVVCPEGMSQTQYAAETAAIQARETQGLQAIHLRLTQQALAAGRAERPHTAAAERTAP